MNKKTEAIEEDFDQVNISIKKPKSSSVNIDSLFTNDISEFRMTNDLRQALIFEMISSVSLNKEKEFENILNMDIDLFEPFALTKEYEFDDNSLKDDTDYYSNILSLGLLHFPDKYVLKIIKKMTEDPVKLKELFSFNPSAKNYTIYNLIDFNLKESFSFLRNENILTEENLYKVLYLQCYREKHKKLLNLLTNSSELEKLIKYEVFSPKNIDKGTMLAYGIIILVKDLYQNNMLINTELKNDIVSILSVFKETSTYYKTQENKEVKQIIINMLGKNIINLNDIVEITNKDILETFKLEDKDIKKVHEIKANDLDNKLEKKEKSARKLKV